MISWRVALVLLAACNGTTTPTATKPSPPEPATPTVDAPPIAPAAPKPLAYKVAWSSTDFGKKTVSVTGVAFRSDDSLVATGQAETMGGGVASGFVMSFAPDGKEQWFHTIENYAFPMSVAVDPDGSAILAGSFGKRLVIDGKEVATAVGDLDTYVLKFGRDGALAWSFTARSAKRDYATGVAILPDGRIAITGVTMDTISFGDVTAKTAGELDIFLATLDKKGIAQWATTIGGPKGDESSGIAVATRGTADRSDGAMCITGYVGEHAKFDATHTIEIPTGNGRADAFIACFRFDGTLRWTERLGDPDTFDRGFAINPVGNGDIAFAGEYEGRVFLARYGVDGKQRWLRRGMGSSVGRGIVGIAKSDDVLLSVAVRSGEPVRLFGMRGELALAPHPGDTAYVRYLPDGEPFSSAQFIANSPVAPQRNGQDADVRTLATSASGRIAGAGRLLGNTEVGESDLIDGAPKLVARLPNGGVIIVLDPE